MSLGCTDVIGKQALPIRTQSSPCHTATSEKLVKTVHIDHLMLSICTVILSDVEPLVVRDFQLSAPSSE
jgi:hypothetical protein